MLAATASAGGGREAEQLRLVGGGGIVDVSIMVEAWKAIEDRIQPPETLRIYTCYSFSFFSFDILSYVLLFKFVYKLKLAKLTIKTYFKCI